ncbi:hypothetical protein AKO1_002708 [Acrasis kona]|uniref:Uncharacterized protein n=1 Tax=Acrasis kona TaxID=1008807 RepID=A0AAW2ZNK3_9EUKA
MKSTITNTSRPFNTINASSNTINNNTIINNYHIYDANSVTIITRDSSKDGKGEKGPINQIIDRTDNSTKDSEGKEHKTGDPAKDCEGIQNHSTFYPLLVFLGIGIGAILQSQLTEEQSPKSEPGSGERKEDEKGWRGLLRKILSIFRKAVKQFDFKSILTKGYERVLSTIFAGRGCTWFFVPSEYEPFFSINLHEDESDVLNKNETQRVVVGSEGGYCLISFGADLEEAVGVVDSSIIDKHFTGHDILFSQEKDGYYYLVSNDDEVDHNILNDKLRKDGIEVVDTILLDDCRQLMRNIMILQK